MFMKGGLFVFLYSVCFDGHTDFMLMPSKVMTCLSSSSPCITTAFSLIDTVAGKGVFFTLSHCGILVLESTKCELFLSLRISVS